MRLRAAAPHEPSVLGDGEVRCILAAAVGMIGETIDQYRIEEKLGEGGVGEVFRAVDLGLDRSVAIKRLRPELTARTQLVSRFRTEARTLARLNHPNIATLYSLVEDELGLLMVMEFVEGETLAKILRTKPGLPLERSLPLFFQALDGLGYAHERGIIHRDIKGSNLMVKSCGTLKVMDFGIARMLGSQRMTQMGQLVGTPEFMSPEQIRGEETDARSDIYSLGILLYALLSGRMPFAAQSSFDLMKAHVDAPPPPLAKLAPHLPAGLEPVLERSLEKDPALRYETTAEFRAALDPFVPRGEAAETMAPPRIAPAPLDSDEAAPPMIEPTRVMTQVEFASSDEKPTRARAGPPRAAGMDTMDAATATDLEPADSTDPERSPETRTGGDPQSSRAETQTPPETEGDTEVDLSSPASRPRHLMAWFLAPSIAAVFLMGANVLWVGSIGPPKKIAAPNHSSPLETPRLQPPSSVPEKPPQARAAIDLEASAAPRVEPPAPGTSSQTRVELGAESPGASTPAPAAVDEVPGDDDQLAVAPPPTPAAAPPSRRIETATPPEPRKSPASADTRRRTRNAKAQKKTPKTAQRKTQKSNEEELPTQEKGDRGWVVRRR